MTVSLQFIALRIYLEFISVMAFSAPKILISYWKSENSATLNIYVAT